jgi:hypothetical protein
MKFIVVVLALLFTASQATAQTSDGLGTVMQSSGSLTRSESELNLRTRLNELENILKSVEWEPKRESAQQMTKEQHDTEVEWSKWMLSVRKRLKAISKDIQAVLVLKPEERARGSKLILEQMKILTDGLEAEGRKFQSLSNASKARHDVAMNAIRNLKA